MVEGVKPSGQSKDSPKGDDSPTVKKPSAHTRVAKPRRGLRLNPGAPPTTAPVLQGGKTGVRMPPYPLPLKVIVEGGKGSGKTYGPAFIPRPHGGRIRILSFDSATKSGLGLYEDPVTEEVKTRLPEVEALLPYLDIADVVTPQPENDYPGFNPHEPETASIVYDEAMAWLEAWDDDGETENLIIDHAEFAHMDISPSKVIADNPSGDLDKGPLSSFEMHHWGHRTKVSKLLVAYAETIPSHAFVLTGYDKKDAFEKRGRTFVEVQKDTTWAKKWHKPFHVTLRHRTEIEVGPEGTKSTKWLVECYNTKADVEWMFPRSEEFDMTGAGYQLFWDRIKDIDNALEGGDE